MNDLVILALSGKAQSGKTYIARILKDQLKEYGYNDHEIEIHSIAQPIQDYANEICLDEGDVRKAIHDLYATYDRYHGFEDRIYDLVDECRNKGIKVLIVDDLRTEVDIETLKNTGCNLIMIRIERTNEYNSLLTKKQEKDLIECDLDDHKFDYVIKNSGTKRNARTDQMNIGKITKEIAESLIGG